MDLGNCFWFQEVKSLFTESNVNLFSLSFPQIIAFALEGKRSKVTRRPKASDYQRLNLKLWFWFCLQEPCPPCWFVSESREMKRLTCGVWWQVWAGRDGIASGFAPALWWHCPLVMFYLLLCSLYVMCSIILSFLEYKQRECVETWLWPKEDPTFLRQTPLWTTSHNPLSLQL